MTSSEPSPSALRKPFVILIILVVLSCIAVFGTRAFLLNYAQPLAHPTSDPGGAPDSSPAAPAREYPPTVIPLSGPAAAENAEISGMAWYGDTLVLLPQYPERFGSADGALLGLNRTDILAFLDGAQSQALEPFIIPLVAPGIENLVQNFEGFEAIAFHDNSVYLSIEASPDGMVTHLVSGAIAPDPLEIRLDTTSLVEIYSTVALPNISDEALINLDGQILSFSEANGASIYPDPQAHLFDLTLQPLGSIPFPNIEYRLTDASTPDANGRFWVLNTFLSTDEALRPASDPLAAQFSEGPTHSQHETVERLVELQFSPSGITLTDTPPVQLELLAEGEYRNWQALARLEGYGFLLATDKYPQTILAFIAWP